MEVLRKAKVTIVYNNRRTPGCEGGSKVRRNHIFLYKIIRQVFAILYIKYLQKLFVLVKNDVSENDISDMT